jgi:hypothetical protein
LLISAREKARKQMQVVIDIPETYYEYCKAQEDAVEIQLAIKKGTPLPKGHGRLIDKDALGEKLHKYTEAPYQYALTVFNESPIIINANEE